MGAVNKINKQLPMLLSWEQTLIVQVPISNNLVISIKITALFNNDYKQLRFICNEYLVRKS